MKKYFYILMLLATPLAFTACGDDDEALSPSDVVTNTNANAVTSDATVARWEVPHLNGQYDYIVHSTTADGVNYIMEYAKEKYHANWVAYRYDSKLGASKTTRSDAWAAEPFYDNNKQYQVGVGYFNGYNRGHLVGSAERLCSAQANEQTFYMSNMSPMNGNFNSIYWGTVEDLVRDSWGRKCSTGDTLYVVKGGTINDLLGTCAVQNTLGNTVQMAVPRYYFIACLYVQANGNARAIGFWMEHKDYKNESESFLTNLRRSSACSIDELEERTGIDFFCNLPDVIENAVEGSYSMSSWSGL